MFVILPEFLLGFSVWNGREVGESDTVEFFFKDHLSFECFRTTSYDSGQSVDNLSETPKHMKSDVI